MIEGVLALLARWVCGKPAPILIAPERRRMRGKGFTKPFGPERFKRWGRVSH